MMAQRQHLPIYKQTYDISKSITFLARTP